MGYIVYTRLANVIGSCDMHLENRPDRFTNITGWPERDFSPFFMPTYEEVRFPSRQAELQISGWWVEADPNAPAIIVVEGLGGCKYAQAALVPAGILWHDGFNVLLIDLRNTGDSDTDNGYSGVGNKEYLDVLGAWDWLVQEKGFAPERIGILGNSLGSAAVMFAFQHEPRIAAVALNSPMANLPQVIREEMRANNFPGFFAPVSILMGRWVTGENLVAHDPVTALQSAGDRPVWVVHSTADTRIRVEHSYQLQAAAQQAGINATFWIVDDVGHVRVPGVHPEEFRERLGAFFRAHLAAPS
jgi:dipeptidyl aminopeptidase/acylaminoacyl peptidase